MTKSDWIIFQKAKEKWARGLGFSDKEIGLAYKLAKEGRGVSYIDSLALQEAREELLNNKK